MRLAGWINAGLPVVVDVNPRFDGHYVWGAAGKPTGYWGDSAFYYDDYFRNYMSQLRGMGNVSITFNSWNQYTEGSVAVPSQRAPLKDELPQGTGYRDSVQFNWLKDMYSADPRQCSHVHYINGGASKFYVFGAICERWQAFGQDGLSPSVTYGAPTTSEMDTPGGRGKMNHFSKDQQGSAIYWSRGATNAHEVHGGIYLKYFSLHRTSVISVFQQLTSYPRRRGATAGGTTRSRVAGLTGVQMAECGLIVIRHKGFLDVLNEQTLNDWRRTSVINQLRACLSVA